jgi:radical SAM family protein/4Fe-4S single cluster protein
MSLAILPYKRCTSVSNIGGRPCLSRRGLRSIPASFRILVTAKGERRARVPLRALGTLWFNTGTLCNLTCRHCYIESSPKNDRLVYLTAAEVAEYLDEIESGALPTSLIGFTGGEPFMNPDLTAMIEDVLSRGLAALVLTNAMKPMAKCKPALLRPQGSLQRSPDDTRVDRIITGPGCTSGNAASAAGNRRSTGSCG